MVTEKAHISFSERRERYLRARNAHRSFSVNAYGKMKFYIFIILFILIVGLIISHNMFM